MLAPPLLFLLHLPDQQSGASQSPLSYQLGGSIRNTRAVSLVTMRRRRLLYLRSPLSELLKCLHLYFDPVVHGGVGRWDPGAGVAVVLAPGLAFDARVCEFRVEFCGRADRSETSWS